MLSTIPLATLMTVAAMQAPDAGRATAVAPVLGEDVSAVVHVDLTRLDVQDALKRLLGAMADDQAVAGFSKVAGGLVDSLKRAGAKDVFVLLDLGDVPGLPTVAVPLAAGADGKAIAEALCGPGPVRWAECATIRGVAVACQSGALARIRESPPAARPELAPALEAGGDVAIRMAVIPSNTQRRALEETVRTLPPELGGAPITAVTRGLKWAAAGLLLEPRPALRTVVQAGDADAAKVLAKLVQDALGLLAREGSRKPGMGQLAGEIGRFTPVVRGDRITLDADLDKVIALAVVPARASAQHAGCVNNLKMLALAMHNYHSDHNSFPPAFSARDGKPLLSWRVHILPYLEQKELYEAFHLDEPWDSPHNRTLISRMPQVFACPKSPAARVAEGKTTYLVPRGPGTIFPGERAIKIQEVLDGTSNTILIVDAPDDAAVVWTRPDDLPVTPDLDPRVVLGHHSEGTNVAFADGSVKFLKTTMAGRLLKALLTRSGGEVVGGEDF